MHENTIHVRAQRLLSCRDIIQCVFDLNDFEIRTYRFLTLEGPKSADEIGKKLGKDRSTAYRALRQLISCRIVYKKTIILDKGGHQHIYFPVEPQKVRDEMELVLERWIKKMRKAVKTFPEDMKSSLQEDGF